MSPSAPPWSQAAERAREPVASSVRRCHAHLLKVTFSIINKTSMKRAIKKAQAASSTAANLYLQTGASLVNRHTFRGVFDFTAPRASFQRQQAV